MKKKEERDKREKRKLERAEKEEEESDKSDEYEATDDDDDDLPTVLSYSFITAAPFTIFVRFDRLSGLRKCFRGTGHHSPNF